MICIPSLSPDSGAGSLPFFFLHDNEASKCVIFCVHSQHDQVSRFLRIGILVCTIYSENTEELLTLLWIYANFLRIYFKKNIIPQATVSIQVGFALAESELEHNVLS
jgi:hypothetical protein